MTFLKATGLAAAMLLVVNGALQFIGQFNMPSKDETRTRAARTLQAVAWYGYECGRTGQNPYWMLTNLDRIITEK